MNLRRSMLALVLLAGCGSDPTDTPATLAEVQQKIFTPNCTLSSCHSESFKAGDLVLTDGKAYDALVGVDPANAAAKSKGYKRVVAGDAAKSFLYVKVTQPAADEGDRMPRSGTLSQEKVDLLQRWIAAGAPK